jgi:hypothetical protein
MRLCQADPRVAAFGHLINRPLLAEKNRPPDLGVRPLNYTLLTYRPPRLYGRDRERWQLPETLRQAIPESIR